MNVNLQRDDDFLNVLEISLQMRMRSYRRLSNTANNRNRKIKAIRDYLTEYNNRFSAFTLRRFMTIIEYCTDEVHNIEDSQLTVDVMETLFKVHYNRRYVFESLPRGRALEVVLRHAHERRFDFWGLRRGEGELSKKFNPVVECFNTRNLERNRCRNAILFLKYGFQYSCTDEIYEKCCHEFQRRRYGSDIPRHVNGKREMMKKPNQNRMLLIMDTFSAVSGITPQIRTERMRVLSRIYKTIPQPYVTPKELLNEIGSVANNAFFGRLVNSFANYLKYTNNPQGFFDQDISILQPRYLKHLCRCRIRDTLAKCLNLPGGVEKLNLPDRIERYLNLES